MADVDSLQIKISASSEQAASAIDKLTASLTKLKTAFNGGTKKYDNLAKSLKELGDTARGMEDSIGALAKAASAIERLSNIKSVKVPKGIGDGIRNIGLAAEMVTPQSVENLDRMTRSLQRLQNVDLRGLNSVQKAAGKIPGSKVKAPSSVPAESEVVEDQGKSRGIGAVLGRLKERYKVKVDTDALKRVSDLAKAALRHLKALGQRIKMRIDNKPIMKLSDVLPKLSKTINGLGRVAFYRAIRTAIKAVTQAFDEGLKNAYAFSAGLSNVIDGRIAVALDSLSGHAMTMKNQLGAAFGSLLTAIAPIINAIISLITALATAITQLFAAFSGGTFLKAKDVSGQFADNMKKGGGAAKEWKNQLMGFDEINRLEEPAGGGGGGGVSSLDPKDMFEVMQIDEAIKDFVDKLKKAVLKGKWKEVGKLLGDKINEMVEKINWSGIGKKLGYWFNGAIQSLYYTLATIDFVKLGKRVASLINAALDQIDFKVWGRLLVRKLTAAIDFFIGLLGSLNWKNIGKKIGDFLRGALDEASEWLDNHNWAEIATKISDNLIKFIDGLDPGSLALSLTTFIGKAKDALVELVTNIKWGEVVDKISKKLSEFFENLSPGLQLFVKLAVGIGIAVAAFTLLYNTVMAISTAFKVAKAAIALLTSPLGLVVIAIAAAVAAGIALYKNWDTIKQKATELWEKIKTTWDNIKQKVQEKVDVVVEFAAKVKNDAEEWWNDVKKWWNAKKTNALQFVVNVKNTAAEWWANVKTWWEEKKGDVSEFATNVKNDSTKWWSNVKTWWNSKKGLLEVGVSIKNEASKWWSNVKAWWNSTVGDLTTKLHIKLPKVSVTWESVSDGPLGSKIKKPVFSILWNAKGGIVDGATLIGAGEAGKEAIIPLERNTEWIGKIASELNTQVNKQDNGASDGNDEIISAIFAVGTQVVNAIVENSSSGDVDWRKIAQNVTRYQNQMARAGAY